MSRNSSQTPLAKVHQPRPAECCVCCRRPVEPCAEVVDGCGLCSVAPERSTAVASDAQLCGLGWLRVRAARRRCRRLRGAFSAGCAVGGVFFAAALPNGGKGPPNFTFTWEVPEYDSLDIPYFSTAECGEGMTGLITIDSGGLTHRVPAYAYRIEQKPLAGRFDIQKARELNIPPGPVYAQLKNGETVTLADGRVIDGTSLCGAERPGASVVYCTDTVFCEAAVDLARGADLLIHESTFAHQESEMAYQKQHSTSTMAAQTAAEANVGQLVLTHLSPRYAPGNAVTPEDLLKEAQAIFPNTCLAKDFLTLEVKPRCNSL